MKKFACSTRQMFNLRLRTHQRLFSLFHRDFYLRNAFVEHQLNRENHEYECFHDERDLVRNKSIVVAMVIVILNFNCVASESCKFLRILNLTGTFKYVHIDHFSLLLSSLLSPFFTFL